MDYFVGNVGLYSQKYTIHGSHPLSRAIMTHNLPLSLIDTSIHALYMNSGRPNDQTVLLGAPERTKCLVFPRENAP